MLTEETVQDKIEIVSEHKFVQVRTATVIKRDDVEISRSFSRHVVAPDADITGERERFKLSVMRYTPKRLRMPMPHTWLHKRYN